MNTEFAQITKQDIIQTIQTDLKGKPYQELFSEIDGIQIEPVYTIEETVVHELSSFMDSNEWQIGQYFLVGNPKETNQLLLEELNRGVNSLFLDFSSFNNASAADFGSLLQNIHLSFISIHCRNLSKENAESLAHWLKSNNTVGDKYQITSDTFIHEDVKFIGIKVTDIESMSKALEAIDQHVAKADQMYFEVEIGANYFYEISKIRALKWLWSKMMAYYQKQVPIYIIAVTSLNNKNKEDINYNMLRLTTEAMSAIVGGVDVLLVYPFDFGTKESNEFSRRISKNLQIILSEESGFATVQDPAKGSYYIENLTQKIAEKVWEKFRS